jgi:hypothetical protein
MAWPALFNRYPLLYPDSMTYLEDGRLVARALFLHQLSDYYGMRSLIYSLGILPFHWNVTPWPVVALQAFLTAYVIWLVVRSILAKRTVACYLALVALLSLLTGLSWFVSLIMPDILGSVLYLCIDLLVFARETLTRAERVAVMLIAWFAVASHATHLMLAAGLCVLLALLLLLRHRSLHPRLRAVGEVAMIIVLAAAAHMALHGYLYGEPSLNGGRPPFLMARVIADGPGAWYLQQHCGLVKLAICDYVQDLPNDPDDFMAERLGGYSKAASSRGSAVRAGHSSRVSTRAVIQIGCQFLGTVNHVRPGSRRPRLGNRAIRHGDARRTLALPAKPPGAKQSAF